MKDHLHELVSQSSTTAEAGLIVHEYLQARVLEALQRAGAFSTWAFLGGNALRFRIRGLPAPTVPKRTLPHGAARLLTELPKR
ncbi:MAG: hypothetical protein GVY14_14095 [Spirochaetes bacterium]|jgi:hypothetical protein|nr:hypothetical protein [Spirochaetota bacterium]